VIAHLALASPFLVSGVSKAVDFQEAVVEFRLLTGFEPAAIGALAVIAAQLGGSALLMMGGRWTKVGALGLAVFVALATLLAHAWWTKVGIDRVHDLNTFWEHVAMIGGLTLAGLNARTSPRAPR
jgi:uncharacterized membrane protein YphA (DoxX/SURF4 family)